MLARFLAPLTLLAAAAQGAPLAPAGAIPMPGVKGRIDHFAADIAGHRLFVAALGNDTVEVLDTGSNRHVRSLPGFGEPQGVAYVASPPRLFVASGGADRVDVLDGVSLAPVQRIAGLPDADNVRLDAAARRVIVGYGKGALRMMGLDRPQSGPEIRLPAHPESFQLEKGGPRIFVNVPDARQVAVVDRAAGKVLATWEVPAARANFPMALDEGGKRLFVGARRPSVLLVYDTASGKVVATVPIGGDTDDVFFDAERKRIYAVCGEGRIDVLKQETPDKYVLEASVPTAPRARTGLYIPEEDKLYVGAPAVEGSQARILVFHAKGNGA